MRFPSPTFSISRAARSLALAALAVAVFSMGGACEDKHIGRPCELGTTPAGGSSGQITIISSPALECPSRICILPGAMKDPMGTGPLCTATCDSNEDCEDGETGPKGDLSDNRCETGFACVWQGNIGNFPCQRFCMCRDFVFEPMGGFTQPADCH
jgi:hypothetical protein